MNTHAIISIFCFGGMGILGVITANKHYSFMALGYAIIAAAFIIKG